MIPWTGGIRKYREYLSRFLRGTKTRHQHFRVWFKPEYSTKVSWKDGTKLISCVLFLLWYVYWFGGGHAMMIFLNGTNNPRPAELEKQNKINS